MVLHSSSSSGPAARWMAPSTPPPPSSDSLAALTIASTASVVMSASITSICVDMRCPESDRYGHSHFHRENDMACSCAAFIVTCAVLLAGAQIEAPAPGAQADAV